MKKLLLLGGFPQMIDILYAAREMGIYTVVADNNRDSVVKRFAVSSFTTPLAAREYIPRS